MECLVIGARTASRWNTIRARGSRAMDELNLKLEWYRFAVPPLAGRS